MEKAAQRRIAVGDTFGKWTVSGAPFVDRGHLTVVCLCECGTQRTIRAETLRRGVTKSCGCAKKKYAAAIGRNSSVYRRWQQMKDRCLNQKSKAYPGWGGRGIMICPEWIESFQRFYDDMGPRPSPQHTLDRIDNDGPYSKANCRWATPTEQQNNTRQNHRLTFDGRSQTVAQWARETGLPTTTIWSRLAQGWTTEETLTQPNTKRKPHVRPRRREECPDGIGYALVTEHRKL